LPFLFVCLVFLRGGGIWVIDGFPERDVGVYFIPFFLFCGLSIPHEYMDLDRVRTFSILLEFHLVSFGFFFLFFVFLFVLFVLFCGVFLNYWGGKDCSTVYYAIELLLCM